MGYLDIAPLGTFKETHGDNTITINAKDISRFFRPSYCITAWKSQGQTYREPYNLRMDYFDAVGKYVVLSRATDIKYISIIV